ncbi:hypothetical protein GCM10022245_67520 [Streptomyces mayteni]
MSGGAGAGKTTLALALAGHAGGAGPVRVVHGDDYYVDERGRGSWLPDENGVPRLDVGDPRSMDFARLDADVAAALAAAPRPVAVIVEGMFAFRCRRPATTDPRLPRLPRLDVFVDLAADLRLARKIHRQCVRGDFPVAVLLANYLNLRRDAFLRQRRTGARHLRPGGRRRTARRDAGRARLGRGGGQPSLRLQRPRPPLRLTTESGCTSVRQYDSGGALSA